MPNSASSCSTENGASDPLADPIKNNSRGGLRKCLTMLPESQPSNPSRQGLLNGNRNWRPSAARKSARLAEKLGVLETDDDVLAGMFLELKSAMESNGSRLKQWRDAGGRFRCPKSERSKRHTADAAPHTNGADSHGGM